CNQRYQRFRLCQSHPLAWAVHSLRAGRRDGRGLVDYPIGGVAALFLYAQTHRHAVVPQPCHGYDRPQPSTYSGEFGFLIVEPAAGDPGRYDREVILAAHHWEGSWVSMQDIRKGPPPDNGLEVLYTSASFNDKMLGHGEPIRVREGQ